MAVSKGIAAVVFGGSECGCAVLTNRVTPLLCVHACKRRRISALMMRKHDTVYISMVEKADKDVL